MTEFEKRLLETGGELEGTPGYGRDAEFRYRWLPDRIHVGLRNGFDRWAVSLKYVLHRSINRINLDVLRHACHLAQNSRRLEEDGVCDLSIFYRQARRKMGK